MASVLKTKRILITKGDTLSELAIAYGTDIETLLSLNPDIVCRDLIYAGNGLYVPAGETPRALHSQELVQPITAQVTPDSGVTVCSNVQPSPCTEMEPEEIVYIPSTRQWFILTADLKKQVEEVVERLKVVSQKAGKLYEQPANTDAKTLHQLRNEVFNDLEKEGLLEAFKGGYYATFMDEPTRKEYTELKLQRMVLINLNRDPTYTDQLSAERYEEIKHFFDSTAQLQIPQALAQMSDADAMTQIAYLPKPQNTHFPSYSVPIGSLGNNVRAAFARAIAQVSNKIERLEQAAWAYASDKYQLTQFKNKTVNKAQVTQYREIWPALSITARERIQGFAMYDYAKETGLIPAPHPDIPSDDRPSLQELWRRTSDDNDSSYVPLIEEIIRANENGAVLPEQVLPIHRLLGGFGNWMDIQREDKRIEAWSWQDLPKLNLIAAQTKQAPGALGAWGLRQWEAMRERVKALLEEHAVYQHGTLGNAGEHLLKPGLVALELCYKEAELITQAAQKQADKGADGILPGCYHPKRIAAKLSLLWKPADFSFDIPTMLRNTESKQLVECYLMSKSKQLCYITTHELGLITKLPNLFAKELILQPTLKEPDKKTTVKKWLDSGEFSSQFKKQIKLEWPKLSVKGEVDEDFVKLSGGLYFNWLEVKDGGLVTMHTDAQAAFFRFSSGAAAEQKFDKLLEAVNTGDKGTAFDALMQLGSAQANMSLDVAKGQMGMTLYVPHHKGHPFCIEYITQAQETKVALLGLFRLRANTTLFGWTGASVVMAGQLNLAGGNGAFSISGSEALRHDSSEPYSYNKGYKNRQASAEAMKDLAGAGATVDAFAGVELGVCTSGSVEWKPWHMKPEGMATQYVGVLSESTIKEMLASGKESHLTELIDKQLMLQHHVRGLNNNFEELLNLSRSVAVNWGLGAGAGFSLGIYNQKLVAGFSARLVCGIGTSGEFAAEVSPLALEKLVNAYCNLLAQENFVRLAVFSENEQKQSSYRFLNEAMTFVMVSGATLLQALLMDFKALLKKNNEAMRLEYAPDVAKSIVDETNRLTNEPWFERLLPEVRGRLFYLLCQAPKGKSHDDHNNMALQAQALSMLLGYWSNDIQAKGAAPLPRQIEESFTRYTTDGEKPFPHDNPLYRYCNRLMPIAVFLKVQQVIEGSTIAIPEKLKAREKAQALQAKYFSQEFERVLVDDPVALVELNTHYQELNQTGDGILKGFAQNKLTSWDEIKTHMKRQAVKTALHNRGQHALPISCFYVTRGERPEADSLLKLAWFMVCDKVGLAPESVKK